MKSWKTLFSVPAKTNGPLQFSRPHRTDFHSWKCGRGVGLVNSWINDFHSRWCILWLTNCGARRRCLIYPRLRMDCIFLDSGTRMPEIGLWNLDIGILLGDLLFYVHGSHARICSTFSSPLFQSRLSSIIYLWNIGLTQALGILQVL